MILRSVSRLTLVLLATGLVVGLTTPAGAAAGPVAVDLVTAPAGQPEPAPDMLAALQRDLGLTAEQARTQLALARATGAVADTLRENLGERYGGAWLEDDQLVVGVTDASQAGAVRAAGARPQLVRYGETTLVAAVATLDAAGRPDPSAVHGWGVDVSRNQVVVQAAPEAMTEARSWLLASGVDPAMVRVEESVGAPRLTWDVIGGNRYSTSAGACSIGFSVHRGAGDRGFVTAGHCGGVGTTTFAFNGSSTIELGTFANSQFPTADQAYVKVKIYAGCTRPGNQACWFTRPWVNQYAAGGNLVVTGGQEAPVGAAVCRSGSTTGWHCGTITAKNQTVNYPQGIVFGLTETTACAEPGDSGGPFVTGTEAQGVTSGGSGNCTVGGVTFFQPLQPILQAYGLTLITG